MAILVIHAKLSVNDIPVDPVYNTDDFPFLNYLLLPSAQQYLVNECALEQAAEWINKIKDRKIGHPQPYGITFLQYYKRELEERSNRMVATADVAAKSDEQKAFAQPHNLDSILSMFATEPMRAFFHLQILSETDRLAQSYLARMIMVSYYGRQFMECFPEVENVVVTNDHLRMHIKNVYLIETAMNLFDKLAENSDELVAKDLINYEVAVARFSLLLIRAFSENDVFPGTNKNFVTLHAEVLIGNQRSQLFFAISLIRNPLLPSFALLRLLSLIEKHAQGGDAYAKHVMTTLGFDCRDVSQEKRETERLAAAKVGSGNAALETQRPALLAAQQATETTRAVNEAKREPKPKEKKVDKTPKKIKDPNVPPAPPKPVRLTQQPKPKTEGKKEAERKRKEQSDRDKALEEDKAKAAAAAVLAEANDKASKQSAADQLVAESKAQIAAVIHEKNANISLRQEIEDLVSVANDPDTTVKQAKEQINRVLAKIDVMKAHAKEAEQYRDKMEKNSQSIGNESFLSAAKVELASMCAKATHAAGEARDLVDKVLRLLKKAQDGCAEKERVEKDLAERLEAANAVYQKSRQETENLKAATTSTADVFGRLCDQYQKNYDTALLRFHKNRKRFNDSFKKLAEIELMIVEIAAALWKTLPAEVSQANARMKFCIDLLTETQAELLCDGLLNEALSEVKAEEEQKHYNEKVSAARQAAQQIVPQLPFLQHGLSAVVYPLEFDFYDPLSQQLHKAERVDWFRWGREGLEYGFWYKTTISPQQGCKTQEGKSQQQQNYMLNK